MCPRLPKTLLLALVSFCAGTMVSAVASPPAQTQTASPVTLVSFMRVPPGGAAEYQRLEREVWRPIHEERIRSGEMVGWDLYSVRFPGGVEQPYTHVTVDTYGSLADLDRSGAAAVARVYPTRPLGELLAEANATRERVRTELWTRLESLR